MVTYPAVQALLCCRVHGDGGPPRKLKVRIGKLPSLLNLAAGQGANPASASRVQAHHEDAPHASRILLTGNLRSLYIRDGSCVFMFGLWLWRQISATFWRDLW